MHHKIALHEVETVADGLEWAIYHLLLNLGRELGQFVNGLQGIGAVWHAEGHVEFVLPDQLALEVVLLQHLEIFGRFGSHPEVQSGSHLRKLEELRPKVVLNKSDRVVVFLADLTLRFLDLKEVRIGIRIPDLEVDELDFIHVVLRRT